LLDVTREEEAARIRIVRYEPRDDREAKLKLTYIAAYLMATKRTLKTVEMAAVMVRPEKSRAAIEAAFSFS
jgi:hypothetical protein